MKPNIDISRPQSKTKRASERAAHSWAADLGPGLASLGTDNDPSGIATYSLAGAQFGYDMLWVCVLSYPSMVALQLISTRVAAITGKELTANMRAHYSRLLFYVAVARFLVGNTFNIAADIVALGVAAHLLWGGSVALFAMLLSGASLALQWLIPYGRYAKAIKWLTLGLFAYVGVALMLKVPWSTVAFRALVPHAIWTDEYISVLLAVLGTTISPYLLFSQAEQEVEEQEHSGNKGDSPHTRGLNQRRLRAIQLDALLRTALSNSIGFFIIIAAAATLHATQGRVNSVEDLAAALGPLANGLAPYVLGLALIGTALLALPPLCGSAALAVASVFDWQHGDQRDRFIALTVSGLMLLGALIALSLIVLQIDAVKALYWSALLNGLTVSPVLILLVLLSTKRAAVGDLSAHWSLRALCWLATILTSGVLTAHFVLKWM